MLCQVKQSHGFFLNDLTAEALEIYVVLEVDLLVEMVCASVQEGLQKETSYAFYGEDWIQFFQVVSLVVIGNVMRRKRSYYQIKMPMTVFSCKSSITLDNDQSVQEMFEHEHRTAFVCKHIESHIQQQSQNMVDSLQHVACRTD